MSKLRALLGLLAFMPALAWADLQGQLALESHHVNRGLTASAKSSRLGASLREGHYYGLYQQVQVETLSLDDGASMRGRVGYTLGQAATLEGWQWDAGLGIQSYPLSGNLGEYGTLKLHADLSYAFELETVGVYADYFNDHLKVGAAYYAEAYARFPLSDGFEASLHAGQQGFADAVLAGTAGYAYRKLEINKRAGAWMFGFSYHIVGVPGDVCFGGLKCAETAVFSLSRDFFL